MSISSRESGLRFHSARVSSGLAMGLGMQVITGLLYRGPALVPRAQVRNLEGSTMLIALARGCCVGCKSGSYLWGSQAGLVRSLGSLYSLSLLKPGDSISSLEQGGAYSFWSRAPGTCSKVLYLSHCKLFAMISIPSGLAKRVRASSTARLGSLSMAGHRAEVVGSAGRARRRGSHPTVRGIAKNPVDHPNGGRSNTPVPYRSAWGWVAKRARLCL